MVAVDEDIIDAIWNSGQGFFQSLSDPRARYSTPLLVVKEIVHNRTY
jgi:hypothetical protein